LTGAEYKQLTQQLVAFNRFLKAKKINWGAGLEACRKVGAATALLQTQRRSCLGELATFHALANFSTAEPKCTAAARATTGTTTTPTTATGATTTTTGATTTGTTTTGTATTGTTTTTDLSATALKAVVCLNPEYQALGRVAKAMYPRDIAARKEAIKRGFKGRCLATIGGTPAQLRAEEQFAFTSTHLAADAAVLTKVTRGQAPSSDLNPVQLEDDARAFEVAAKAVLTTGGPDKLSVCPHL